MRRAQCTVYGGDWGGAGVGLSNSGGSEMTAISLLGGGRWLLKWNTALGRHRDLFRSGLAGGAAPHTLSQPASPGVIFSIVVYCKDRRK